MKRIPKEILVLIAIFLAGVGYVLWFVHTTKARRRADSTSTPAVAPVVPR